MVDKYSIEILTFHIKIFFYKTKGCEGVFLFVDSKWYV